RARLCGVARLHLAAGAGVGRTGCDRRADRSERHQLLAGVDRGLARRRARRLVVVLDRPQARPAGRTYMAAVAPSRAAAAWRGLREKMGRVRDLYRPFLRATARVGALS